MPKFNFSTEEMQVYDLALDLARGDFSLHVDGDKVSKKDLEDHLRETINNDILKGATLYQAYRRNNIVMFEIIEEIVNTTIAEDVLESPFIDAFVEVKNRALGDKTAFYSEGGLLSVASFLVIIGIPIVSPLTLVRNSPFQRNGFSFMYMTSLSVSFLVLPLLRS